MSSLITNQGHAEGNDRTTMSHAVAATLTVAWLVVLSAWIPVALGIAIAGPDARFTRSDLEIIVTLIGAAALATVVLGFTLGWCRLWLHVGIEVILGTLVLMTWYVVSIVTMSFDTPAEANADAAAGAGVVILTLPTAILIGALLGLGAGAGWVFSRIRLGA